MSIEINAGQDLKALVGRSYESDWLLIDQPLVDAFADATGDHQYIHVDPVRAAQTPFGGTIAHGFLLLSLLPRLHASSPRPDIKGVAMSINYGFDRVRFLAPVRVGSRIKARFTIAEMNEKRPGQYQQLRDVAVEMEEAERPAVTAQWISQFILS